MTGSLASSYHELIWMDSQTAKKKELLIKWAPKNSFGLHIQLFRRFCLNIKLLRARCCLNIQLLHVRFCLHIQLFYHLMSSVCPI
jgi:hypothetical protein